MQSAAESTASDTPPGSVPTASVVVIDNETGGVKAMVGGNDFEEAPLNLATQGLRQPGRLQALHADHGAGERLQPVQHLRPRDKG